jgi:phosphoribosylformimino-5-aminoimidazole carboxamide ribotide isomerase
MLLIPSIDLSQGRAVRLWQGDFAQATLYPETPAALLARYETLGAAWVHIVDLDGARDGRRANHALIASLSGRTSIKLQVGGGVRSTDAIEDLLDVGVSRVVIGSAALRQPQDVREWLKYFGAERIALAFDVRIEGDSEPRVQIDGWQSDAERGLWRALAPYRSFAHHILCTDIGRDGTLTGPNLDLYREVRLKFPAFAWQASGGIRGSADLNSLARLGLAAAISGKALLENRITPEEWRPYLPAASFPVSTYGTDRS